MGVASDVSKEREGEEEARETVKQEKAWTSNTSTCGGRTLVVCVCVCVCDRLFDI
jgi:hypothetical protein